MKRRRKIHLVHTACKRCGTPLVTTNRSIYGADTLKAELGPLCEKCITPDEKQKMLEGQLSAAMACCAR